MSNPTTIEKVAPDNEKGFFGKLVNGDYGLPKTYWLFGVLVGVIVNVISNTVTSIEGRLILTVGHAIYWIPVAIGIWRAASKYQGPKIWAILAKIAMILGIVMLAAKILSITGLLIGQA